MNSCILMAQIIQDPELRYTSDNQTPIAQMLVEFPGIKAEDPPTTLKVVGWRELAHDIKENYAVGDRVVIEGRLGMNTIERSEGFKEKRAELTASRIYKLGADTELEPQVSTSSATFSTPTPASTPKSNNVVVPMRARTAPAAAPVSSSTSRDYSSSLDEPSFEPPATIPTSDSEKDLDDIPF